MEINIQVNGRMDSGMAKGRIIQLLRNKHIKASMKKAIDQEKENFY